MDIIDRTKTVDTGGLEPKQQIGWELVDKLSIRGLTFLEPVSL